LEPLPHLNDYASLIRPTAPLLALADPAMTSCNCSYRQALTISQARNSEQGPRSMRVTVVGKGNVGKALAPNIAAAGHDVVYGVRNPQDRKYATGDSIPLKRVGDAVSQSDIVILAVHWGAVDSALAECGRMDGKILVDCTNPYDFRNNLAPLVPADRSAATIIAGKTAAKVVKTFNQVGAAVMAAAPNRRPKPLQFVAADDAAARAVVIALAKDIGFDARDAGGLDYARELEGMARLWIAQAFGHGMPPTAGWLLTAD
jgi:predicted dinucleotide-binding enzyme